MKDQWKIQQNVNQAKTRKPEGGERDTETRTEEITQETQDTQENPKNLTVQRRRHPNNMVKIVTLANKITSESGEKLMDTDATECLVIRLAENGQRSGATEM